MSPLASAETVDEHVMACPAPALRGVVDFYSGYRQRGLAPAVHRGLPSPYLTLIFTLDEPLCLAATEDALVHRYDALLGGLHTEPVLVHHDGAQSGVQLRVDPLWARRLFGVPGGALAVDNIPPGTVLGAFAHDVHERLRLASSWNQRFHVLDEALLDLLRRNDTAPPAAEIRRAWRLLLARRGDVGVAALSDDVGWSERHLARQLRVETGLSTKTAARVIRFDAARRHLQRTPTTIADLAAAHGYHDQSHLVRDFTAFAGLPPSRWRDQKHIAAPDPIKED